MTECYTPRSGEISELRPVERPNPRSSIGPPSDQLRAVEGITAQFSIGPGTESPQQSRVVAIPERMCMGRIYDVPGGGHPMMYGLTQAFVLLINKGGAGGRLPVWILATLTPDGKTKEEK